MREVRVFVERPLSAGKSVTLPLGPARHVARVLRLRTGSSLTLFNDQGGEYRGEIERMRGEDVEVKVISHLSIERESPRALILLQGVARSERMDLIVQKATELGVTHILPIACARSVVQLDIERANKRQEHWRATAIAACEQCGRNRLPIIEPVRSLADALEALSTAEYADFATRGLLDPQAALTLAQWVSRATASSAPVALLIGPEGGLQDSEQTIAEQHDFTALRLGPRILRTETAALAALAAIQSLAGDFA